MDQLAELRKQIHGSKVVIGTAEVSGLLKQGGLAKVFIASNCPDGVKADIRHYCGISGCELVELSVPNNELGILCKKPFSIAVVGILK